MVNVGCQQSNANTTFVQVALTYTTKCSSICGTVLCSFRQPTARLLFKTYNGHIASPSYAFGTDRSDTGHSAAITSNLLTSRSAEKDGLILTVVGFRKWHAVTATAEGIHPCQVREG